MNAISYGLDKTMCNVLFCLVLIKERSFEPPVCFEIFDTVRKDTYTMQFKPSPGIPAASGLHGKEFSLLYFVFVQMDRSDMI